MSQPDSSGIANPPPDQREKSRSAHAVIGRLVRGEERLPVAFWGWGVAGNLLLFFTLDVLGDVLPVVPEIVLYAGGVLLYAYGVFSAVVIWRSALRYSGNPWWSALARGAVVATILCYLVFIWITLALISSPGH